MQKAQAVRNDELSPESFILRDSEVAGLKEKLARHPLYEALKTPEALRTFAEHHAFAVWDFMSIVKGLQRELTCVAMPWTPVADPAAARLINEIVLGEESDEAPGGGYASHFETYLKAMDEIGADGSTVLRFSRYVGKGMAVAEALEKARAPEPARDFVLSTFAQLEGTPLHTRAALLLYGREDLIPAMFRGLVAELAEAGLEARTFLWYLDRHIEVDGKHHSVLAGRLLKGLCGQDRFRWEDCRSAAVKSMRARLDFWNRILAAVRKG